MRQAAIVFLALGITLGFAAGQPQWFPVGQGGQVPESPYVTTSTHGKAKVSFDVDLSGYMVRDTFTKGGTFRELVLPRESFTGEIGQAKLPMIRRLLEVPQGASVSVRIRDAVYEEVPLERFGIIGEILPVQDSIPKTADGFDNWTFSRDGNFYATDAFLPESPVVVGDIAMYRNHRVVQVDIFPVRYNPARGMLKVCTYVGFDVLMAGGDAVATEAAVQRTWSPSFEEDLSKRLINYGMFLGGRTESVPAPKTSHWDGMLIISHPDFYTMADELAQWRRKMGYKVEHVDTGAGGTNGSDVTSIKNYIQNAYDTWTNPGLGFVLLVGDTAQIGSPSGSACSGCPSDSDYACVSGTDNIHDLYIGRASVETVAQATEVFDRLMTYTKAAFTLPEDWIKRICFSSSCDSTINTYHTHEATQSAYTLPNGYTGEYYPGTTDPGGDLIRCIEDYGGSSSSSGADVVNAINNGRSMIVYSGHGGYTNWSGPSVSIGNLQAATSGEMAPFMVGHCCIAHTIDYGSPCFGESCLREVAVGYYGASESSYWGEDDYLQLAWFDKIFTDGQLRMGQFMTNAMIDLYNNYSTSRGDYYMDMELLDGDPSMEIYTEIPEILAVTHDPVMIIGGTTFAVDVYRSGAPLTGARVCLTKDDGGDTIAEFGLTDGSGKATLNLNPAPGGVGILNVTVTAQNSKPYEATVTVIVPSGPYMAYDTHTLDDSAGNGDGIVNPGETISMPVTLRNIGVDPAAAVSGTLTETSTHCTITDGSANFPNIGVGATGQSTPPHFSFQVGAGAPNGHSIPFTIDWTADAGTKGAFNGAAGWNVPICEPLLITNVQVADVTGTSALVTWTTNVGATSTVTYGMTPPPGTVVQDDTPATSHSVALNGLSECSNYYFSVGSESPACYQEIDDNNGAYYAFTTGINVNPTYPSTDTPMAIPDQGTANSVMSVSDDKLIQDVNVQVNITHTYDGDLDIYLVGPTGAQCELTTDNGGGGDNFINTVFDDEASTPITSESASAPYTGSYQPEGSLAIFDGVSALGDWTLEITDDAPSDMGTLNSWNIMFEYPSEACGLTCSATVPASGTTGQQVQFQSAATAPVGPINYDWGFGDGSAHSSQQNPLHTYALPGDYLWTLTVTADGETCIHQGTITISDPSGNCTLSCLASASPAGGSAPLTVAFTATAVATDCSGPVTYFWDFGDGDTSTLEDPSHTYVNTGSYGWSMTASADGETCVRLGTVVVGDPPPCMVTCTAGTSVSSGTSPVTVDFSATFSAPNCPGDAVFYWIFGDGNSSFEQNPTHTYNDAGIFSWSVTVEVAGISCTRFGRVTAYAPPCSLACSASATPVQGPAPLTVAYTSTAQAQNCSGSPTFTWDFGDGSGSAEQNPVYTYITPGTYGWNLTVQVEGETCTQSGTITVGEACSLTCSGAATPQAGPAPLDVLFSGSAQIQNCQDAPTFSWDFGDGATSKEQNVTHQYVAPGIYTWTLTAAADGETCTHTGTVTAEEPCALACTSQADPQIGTAPLAVAFTAGVQETNCVGVPTCAWDFGDGEGSLEPSPSHTFTDPGVYTWTMTAEVDGQTCLQTGVVTVDAPPCTLTCTATADPAGGPAPLDVNFSATADPQNCAGPVTYTWNFGDGTTSNLQNVTHTYTEGGDHAWTLTVSVDGVDCVQTGTVSVITCVPGDANGNGQVSIGEVQTVIRMFTGEILPANCADCDGDGRVSIGEVQRVINIFLGGTPTC